MCVCVCVCMFICIFACAGVDASDCLFVYACVCMHIMHACVGGMCMCTDVCVRGNCLCLCVYGYERQTEGGRGTKTNMFPNVGPTIH